MTAGSPEGSRPNQRMACAAVAGAEDEAAERQHGHRPAGPDQRGRQAPAAADQQRTGEVRGEWIAKGRSREQWILGRKVMTVDEGGRITGVERPVGPGVVVMGE